MKWKSTAIPEPRQPTVWLKKEVRPLRRSPLLKEKFVAHQQVIDTYFDTLMMGVG
jgi:hypothetical protein